MLNLLLAVTVATTCPSYHACMNMGENQARANPRLAISYYRQALRTSPKDVEAFIYLHTLEAIVEPQPGSCKEFKDCMDQGYAVARKRNYRGALLLFKRALALDPESRWAKEAIAIVSEAIQRGL